MPYIKPEDRERFEELIKNATETFNGDFTLKVGDLNYFVSSLIWNIFKHDPSYTHGNNLIGVLECVKQEFYRRQLAVLEDRKIKENGDI
jgi:hypothetical protein